MILVVEGVDQGIGNIGEDNLVTGPVQDQADKAAPDVAGTEMDCGAAHSSLTALSSS
jgi:hypothetical protein